MQANNLFGIIKTITIHGEYSKKYPKFIYFIFKSKFNFKLFCNINISIFFRLTKKNLKLLLKSFFYIKFKIMHKSMFQIFKSIWTRI